MERKSTNYKGENNMLHYNFKSFSSKDIIKGEKQPTEALSFQLDFPIIEFLG